MTTYVILLRGVMPTGKNKVPMALLREVLTKAGLKEVRTWIQSGNVIARSALSSTEVEQLTHDEIAGNFGGDIAVMALPAPDFKKAFEGCPFEQDDMAKLYYTFFKPAPNAEKTSEFLAGLDTADELIFKGRQAYLRVDTLYSNSKLNNNFLERKLGVTATTRNHNTMKKLVEMTYP